LAILGPESLSGIVQLAVTPGSGPGDWGSSPCPGVQETPEKSGVFGSRDSHGPVFGPVCNMSDKPDPVAVLREAAELLEKAQAEPVEEAPVAGDRAAAVPEQVVALAATQAPPGGVTLEQLKWMTAKQTGSDSPGGRPGGPAEWFVMSRLGKAQSRQQKPRCMVSHRRAATVFLRMRARAQREGRRVRNVTDMHPK
jgi:hypothetical protein